jgi:hypothetical protein
MNPDLFDYPYLWASLALAGIGVAGSVLVPAWRSLILFGGLLSLPSALFAYEHVPHYWDPRLALTIRRDPLLTIDDLVYCFAVGSVSMLAALMTCRGTVAPCWNAVTVVRRYALCAGVGAGVAQVVHRLFLRPEQVMYSCLLGLAASGAIVLLARPDLRRLSRFSGPAFAAVFTLLLVACGWLWPQAAGYYNPAAQAPFGSYRIPPLEVIFPLCFGTAWPMVAAWCADVRLEAAPSGATTRKPATAAHAMSS